MHRRCRRRLGAATLEIQYRSYHVGTLFYRRKMFMSEFKRSVVRCFVRARVLMSAKKPLIISREIRLSMIEFTSHHLIRPH